MGFAGQQSHGLDTAPPGERYVLEVRCAACRRKFESRSPTLIGVVTIRTEPIDGEVLRRGRWISPAVGGLAHYATPRREVMGTGGRRDRWVRTLTPIDGPTRFHCPGGCGTARVLDPAKLRPAKGRRVQYA